MAPDLDLREYPREEHQELLFDELDDAAADESMTFVADHDAVAELHRYQIKRDVLLEWDRERTDSGAWEIRAAESERLDLGELSEFDVREMPPQRRHTVLLDTFDDLDPGEGFVLVNDHDPKPLYHELRSTRGETFEWEYLSRDSDPWKVEIVKTAASEADDEVLTTFDVREIPKPERHPTIHHRYGNVPVGETMAIIAPHEPRPLRREFEQRYGEAFAWEVVDESPGEVRVHITKEREADGGATDDDVAEPETEGGADDLDVIEELDVRDLPPAQRHEQIYDAYDDLERGEAFVLVNDHDPKPLYHQFEAEAGPEFRWEYRKREAGEFRVRIGKAASSVASAESGPTADDETTTPF